MNGIKRKRVTFSATLTLNCPEMAKDVSWIVHEDTNQDEKTNIINVTQKLTVKEASWRQ